MSYSQALFLDRDGVINKDYGYVHRKENFHFVEGIFELCRTAKRLGYYIFVITNQAGIGRGYYSEQDFLKLTNWMCDVFLKQGTSIDKVYFCPFHPEHGIGRYKVDSSYRKPGPEMILQAAREFKINLEKSFLVGDKETDIQAGIAAGVGYNLLYIESEKKSSIKTTASAVIKSLSQVEPLLSREYETI